MKKNSNVYFWILPVHEKYNIDPRIHRGNLLKYLELFHFKDMRKIIVEYNYKIYKTKWKIRPSGALHSIIILDIDGFATQIKVDEKQQALISFNKTHKIFELLRTTNMII